MTFFMKKMMFAACFLAVFSCKNEVEQPPIDDEKMIRLAADFYSVEAVLNLSTMRERDSLAPIFQAQIFENQGVTKADYEKTVQILSHEPARLDTILARASRLLDDKNKDTRPGDTHPN